MSPDRLLFLALLAFCLTPWASPPLALALGIAFGLTLAHPYASKSRQWSKLLLQASVVGLGFGMNLAQVLKAGTSGLLYTAGGIAFSITLGTLLARWLSVKPTAGYLISVGTAICGGSAIAAVGPILGAPDDEMSVALATVFVLNSIALILFPILGHMLRMSEPAFGLWAALAIHDTSSVVGAAAKYGAVALAVGTTVKLARALWIVPVSVATAAFKRSDAKIHWPWFIAFFALGAALNTYEPFGVPIYGLLYKAGRLGLTATLFLIGSGLSQATLKRAGARPLLQGVLLWLAVASASLLLIRSGVLSPGY